MFGAIYFLPIAIFIIFMSAYASQEFILNHSIFLKLKKKINNIQASHESLFS